jgi:hypothetical protein
MKKILTEPLIGPPPLSRVAHVFTGDKNTNGAPRKKNRIIYPGLRFAVYRDMTDGHGIYVIEKGTYGIRALYNLEINKQ